MQNRSPLAARLPDFPWDTLAAAKARAAAHPGGIVDLSVGTPVDPVAEPIRHALYEGSAFPGYPATIGTIELRTAAAAALHRRYGSVALPENAILPVIGTKEAIAQLPSALGLGSGDTVVIPEVAYPTYEVGALLAGAKPVRADGTAQLVSESPALVFVNSPSNPTGTVLGVDHLRKVVQWAREREVIVASDECYLGLAWDAEPVSILDPRVCDGDLTGLIAIHSLSKTSNLASYRAGFFAGDPALIADLAAVRKHAGAIVPFPVQAAMTYALSVDEHEAQQRARYASRREVLLAAVRGAGFQVDHSEAGLYLWSTRGEACRDTVDWFADRGILVAPGEFYGPQGAQHVRIALTATDERIAAAAQRLAA
ncbi:Succinyldiaminopimelate transaminase OS=Tsukamurella paurometabola (strain ATCC 8368 / DSM /CCUG 35730 / CIP 100753 / JCM 10117 / KCTC 9821 / NBRC 16120/ NCIMB 702349 / NCTC 13040) OX=521096 GN=Tpau_1152 PE=4 SV=1 [Tsukamurella paurometabola]|uniref:Succinyldiaminopimelate transaminase n=1 Tax=Tsukamurella paurometabola (strain ATCC 8368 / DSM 20162 / CCUG 35730 / CIP 100753 / JCM 10117 / KCTC 9821 / NBRC 16120 / NCIMB 702349 / NCTC 13040) TaxID=521096 RepID=D5UVX6_TSUPD|nr:succinyldiaminopimelate transaminase [Tsukamurella paurometabola]ADG77783.1 succinyldiaminopimelate transaminase [Tsukamurella paurometabola DSM 20162]SUP28740.1 LL-diaminopimelate aminotransferase [Tsukamurella paurometabola]